jgi:hypothetical protein
MADTRRKIGGKYYLFYKNYKSKTEAKKFAKHLRETCESVRVIEAGWNAGFWWGVYYRPK